MSQRLKGIVMLIVMSLFSLIFITACTVVIKRPPRPVPRVEVQPPRPGPRTVWVPGHWQWRPRAGRWIWVPGHWRQR